MPKQYEPKTLKQSPAVSSTNSIIQKKVSLARLANTHNPSIGIRDDISVQRADNDMMDFTMEDMMDQQESNQRSIERLQDNSPLKDPNLKLSLENSFKFPVKKSKAFEVDRLRDRSKVELREPPIDPAIN